MTKLASPQKFQKISIVDLISQYESIKDEINQAVLNVLSSGKYILGENVTGFEKELSSYTGSRHVISCANGTDAIVLSLLALGIGSGDEVITVSHTFFATAEAIALTGAKPVFVDIQESDFNIDPLKIEGAITKKTKAIIPVHLYGNPCEIGSVTELARKHNLYVIEDCAQSLGAKYNKKCVGTFGDIGTLSFFPTKNLGAFGDAGAILANSDEIADKLRQLRFHGSPGRYVHDYIGLNSRLDEIQAAVLRIKLKHLDKWNALRLKAAEYYNELFKEMQDIKVPALKSSSLHVFHQYTIKIPDRDYVSKKLNESQIESIIYYPVPVHLQKAFSHLNYKKGSLPVTEKICGEILSLPIYPEITKEIQEYVTEEVIKLIKH